MLDTVAGILLAGVLAVSAGAEARRPRGRAGRDGHVRLRDARLPARSPGRSLVVAELVLAVGVALGRDAAAYAAAALMVALRRDAGRALMRGARRRAVRLLRRRLDGQRLAVGRNLRSPPPSPRCRRPASRYRPTGGSPPGLVVALLACAALAVAVLALAREVGMLRLRLGAGARARDRRGGTGARRPHRADRALPLRAPAPSSRLAVFTSRGCHVCRALEPAVDRCAGEPALAVEVFEEGADADVWEALAIPGAPYAVALERDGTVGAKGTFNNLAQLESVLAAAERRRAERLRIEALGV